MTTHFQHSRLDTKRNVTTYASSPESPRTTSSLSGSVYQYFCLGSPRLRLKFSGSTCCGGRSMDRLGHRFTLNPVARVCTCAPMCALLRQGDVGSQFQRVSNGRLSSCGAKGQASLHYEGLHRYRSMRSTWRPDAPGSLELAVGVSCKGPSSIRRAKWR
jgi:hypothetical protein